MDAKQVYIPSEKVIMSGMLGKALGDALGVPVEFRSRYDLQKSPVKRMLSGGTYEKDAGVWSDDTSMALAAMAAIIDENAVNYQKIMEYFILWYKEAFFTADYDRFDCGGTVGEALQNFMRGTSPTVCGLKEESRSGNGSLMRIFPFAMYYANGLLKGEISALRGIADASALTHAQPLTKESCIIYSTILVYFAEKFDAGLIDSAQKKAQLKEAIALGIRNAKLYEGSLEDKLQFLEDLDALESLKEEDTESLASGGYVLDSLKSSLWCFLNTTSYSECVLKAVNLGADTDTTAAIAGALAGVYYSQKELPAAWLSILKKTEDIKKTCELFHQVLRKSYFNANKKIVELWKTPWYAVQDEESEEDNKSRKIFMKEILDKLFGGKK